MDLARIAPTVGAEERLLPVPELLTDLFPHGGLQQGWSVAVEGVGGWSAALALLGPTLAGDGWAALVGCESVGLVAADELGVRLERLLLVESPGHYAAEVLAALIEAVDVICLGPEVSVASRSARRLVARAREQGTVLLHLGRQWPEPVDVQLHVDPVHNSGAGQNGGADVGGWSGIGSGHGYLRSRSVAITATGRRSMARPRRVELLLPGPDGGLAPVAPATTPAPRAAGWSDRAGGLVGAA
jgi:hypothetical protein